MIIFENCSLRVPASQRESFILSPKKEILSPTNLEIPSRRRIVLMAATGQEIRALLGLISGLIFPTSGRIVHRARVSFPAGHLGSFSNDITVKANLSHFARLYDLDGDALVQLVECILKLGRALADPFSKLKPEQKRLLADVLLFSVPFDTYLLATGVPQPVGKGPNHLYRLFAERTRNAGFIAVARNQNVIKNFCDAALVLSDRRLHLFDDLDEALAWMHSTRRRTRIQLLRGRA